MTINKYQGKTKEEAVEKAKQELGAGAVVLNVKEIKPKGMFKMFKNTLYEVTAAVEEKEAFPAQTLRSETKPVHDTISLAADEKITIPGVARENTRPAVAPAPAEQEVVPMKEAKRESTNEGLEKRLENLSNILEKQFSVEEMRKKRTDMQIIFQDPFSSLSPRLPVGEIIGEAVREHNLVPKAEFNDYIDQVMDNCGLQPYHKTRYPHEFSGGQRQRIGIARTLALQPKLLIADEAVSALDVSVQAQIINLLEELQKSLHLTMLFISHDLSVVRCMTDRAVVMYLGKIMEMGPTEHLFGAPAHPYTRNLIDAVPEPDPDCPPKESTMIGEPPSPMDIPGGCRFHPRCPYAKNVCRRAQPELTDLGGGQFAACHFPYACAGAPQTEAEQ